MIEKLTDSLGQLEEIKMLIGSNIKLNKSLAYSHLLHFQEQSNDDPSSLQNLSQNSQTFLSLIVADVTVDDEEIAAKALKCLGFMIYHPSLVATISVDAGNLVLDSLVKLIITTKLKSVCNLGVWCISIQQFSSAFLDTRFPFILRAVVHALDNPTGSLSTTFEAMQAVMKIATQLSENMRDSSHIWLPPIYRRLLSMDKRDRDMSERCLSKIRSLIIPPPHNLSKVLVVDMKRTLLDRMKELLKHGMNVQTVQAWGWFVRLLGSHATKCRQLVNDMLKIPEQTFSNHDPQVQIASQVAWEGLIDALINPQVLSFEINGASQKGLQRENDNKIRDTGVLKRLKLIMTPLIGVMSSKCDISVHSSCVNTWYHLLQKLETSVNFPQIIELVVEPVLEAIFKVGPDDKSVWLWHLGVDLFDDFVLAKCRDVDYNLKGGVSLHLTDNCSINGPTTSGKCLQQQYAIKWLPWDLGRLEFHMKMIHLLIRQLPQETNTCEKRISECGAALRIFRSVLRGIQTELKSSSANYTNVMFCVKTILRFMKKISEDVSVECHIINNSHRNFLQFVEVVIEELDPSVLGSPLYRVALDLKYIDDLHLVNDDRYSGVLDTCSISYMEMVSPMLYLTVLYFDVVVHSTLTTVETEFVQQRVHKFFKHMFSCSVEIFILIVALLYNHMELRCIKIWILIVKSLKDSIDGSKDQALLTVCDPTGCLAICRLLSYPFLVCSWPQKASTSAKISGSSEESFASSQRRLDIQSVVDTWNSLYVCLRMPQRQCNNVNSFHEDLCLMLSGYLETYTGMIGWGTKQITHKNLFVDLLSLSGEVLICVLENMSLNLSPGETKSEYVGDSRVSNSINNALGFSASFMKFSYGITDPQTGLVTSRVLSAFTHFCSCLHLKRDVLSLNQRIATPLLQFFSHSEIEENTSYQLQLFWTEMLNSLRRSWPPIIFDSAFLRLQAPILEVTLEHPNPRISDPTISFWNSTYGEQTKLDYPQNLANALDKLSRNGRINLHKRSPPFLVKCQSKPDIPSIPHKYRVTATQNNSSKRVKLVEDALDGWQKKEPVLKRKKLEQTEHQKEVRRAQQGREMDSNGHGPGIRTYTTADFLQGNEESQDSQDIQNPEQILEMLRKSR